MYKMKNIYWIMIAAVVLYIYLNRNNGTSSFGVTKPAPLTFTCKVNPTQTNEKGEILPFFDTIQMFPTSDQPVPTKYRGTSKTLSLYPRPDGSINNTITYPPAGIPYSYPFTFYLIPTQAGRGYAITIKNSKNIPVNIVHTNSKTDDIFTVNGKITSVKKNFTRNIVPVNITVS
jgi:hypothetical protein